MAAFDIGEEVICVDAKDAMGLLVEGKTYIVLERGVFCNCCIGVGVGPFCYESRFRRPVVQLLEQSNSRGKSRAL
jgi:hypothetical protein